MIGNSLSAGFVRMLQVHVRTGLFVNEETGFLEGPEDLLGLETAADLRCRALHLSS